MSINGNKSLVDHDPEMYDLIEREKNRQWKCLELIASENLTSRPVMECLGSCLTNKYSEGIPYQRYYGGNEIIDQIEELCQKRALKAFHLNPNEWGVNVQPYSGSPANFATYTALLHPHDRIMGLDLPSGGHLTHGFYTYSKQEGSRKAVSATSVYFESLPYRVHPETGLIDFDKLREQANLFKPAMLICGGSAYPRDWNYKLFRDIANENGSLLMCDMAHISGLVAAQEHNSPFDYCDVVTTTTHKSLRGPRAGMIFYRKSIKGDENITSRINNAVFPALQGGPHEHQIAAIATQLKEVTTDSFKQYIIQVKKNAVALANFLIEKKYILATNGTENHLLLWDLRPLGLTGSKMETLCDEICITLNKNAVLGDRSALSPGGVRIGTPALTSRGFKEEDFIKVGLFLDEAIQLCLEIQKEKGKKLKDFINGIKENNKVNDIKQRVMNFASSFDMPGFNINDMKYNNL